MAMDALTLHHSARCAVVTSAAGASKASPRHACAPVEVKATKVQHMLNPVTANTGSCSNVGRNSSNQGRDYACLAVHAERGTQEVKKEEGQHNMALQDRPILLRNQDLQRTVAAPDSISFLIKQPRCHCRGLWEGPWFHDARRALECCFKCVACGFQLFRFRRYVRTFTDLLLTSVFASQLQACSILHTQSLISSCNWNLMEPLEYRDPVVYS